MSVIQAIVKTISLTFAFLVYSISPAMADATGEGAVRVATTASYYGIQGTLTIPSDVYVSNDGSYIAFYLGLGNICEGGISYTPSTGWKKFLNCGAGSNQSEPLSIQPSPGSTIHLKIVNNQNGTASLYVNGYQSFTLSASSLPSSTFVKMVHSTYDVQDLNQYTNAKFTNVQVRSASGSYSSFPSSIDSNIYPWGKGDYSVPSLNPTLQSSLISGN